MYDRYMERRCKFMESFPGFCFNSGNQQCTVVILLKEDITVGCGTLYDHKNVDPHELKKMVRDKVLVRLQGRYYSNTSQLGQVLMATMLKEVSEFCKINIQQSWATQAHQQVSDAVICLSIITTVVSTHRVTHMDTHTRTRVHTHTNTHASCL